MDSIITENTTVSNLKPNIKIFNWQKLIKYILILIILAFLGLNLFTHVGEIIEYLKNILSLIVNFVLDKTKEVLKITTLNTTHGIESGIEIVKKKLDGKKNNTIQMSDKLLVDENPEPDISISEIQNNVKRGVGYCYVGEDRNIRSCVKVNKKDKCMSGDIFPTREICINPNLRH
tara:strand:- start:1297 stop:1821 length:525 start_codon:yes stop_codon:yes gene_type:complete